MLGFWENNDLCSSRSTSELQQIYQHFLSFGFEGCGGLYLESFKQGRPFKQKLNKLQLNMGIEQIGEFHMAKVFKLSAC